MSIPTMIAESWVDLLAAGCVAVYAWERFSTPATWRSTTTRWQWNVALIGYVGAAMVLWWVVMMVIKTNPEAARFIMFGAGPDKIDLITDDLVTGCAPFAAAVLLTALLPHTPYLKKLDTALGNVFRELGAIPKRARQLSSKVRSADFVVPDRLAGAVANELRSQQLDLGTLRAATPHSPAWNWLRIVTIKTRLCADLVDDDPQKEPNDGLAAERECPFFRHRRDEWEQLMALYRNLASLAEIVLSEPEGGSHQISDARRDDLLRAFENESQTLFRKLSHLASCYLLSTTFGMRDAIRSIEDWGFRVAQEVRPPLIPWHTVVGLALLTMAYVFFLFRVMGAVGGQVDRALVISVTIGVNMAAASLLAGLPGMLARRSGPAGGQRLTFGYYVLAAALAALFWCVVYYLRGMAMEGLSLAEFVVKLGDKFPFMLIPAGAAFFIALLIDLDLRSRFANDWLGRAVEGVFLAVAMGATAYLAADLMRSLAGNGGRFPDPARIMAVQAGLGFILGGIVPELYRRARERNRDRDHDRDDRDPPMAEHSALAW